MTDELKLIEEALSRLPEAVRKRLSDASNLSPERQALPSASLTAALGGGLGYGRIATVFGSKSAGKSSMLLQMIGMAQEDGRLCAWVDAEKAFDSGWAGRLGVDCDNLIYSSAASMDQAGDDMVELIKAGVDLIVVDSISALIPSSYMDKKSTELAGMSNTKKLGTFSQNLKALIKSLNYVNQNTLIVFVSQHTTEINQTYTKQAKDGGNAINYYSSQSVHLVSGNSNSYMIEGDVAVEDRIFRKPVGRHVNWEVEYNKLGNQGETGTYDFYFAGDRVGVDRTGEYFDLAVEYGIINKKGGWFTYDSDSVGEFKLQGRSNFVEELWNTPELAEELKDNVQRFL